MILRERDPHVDECRGSAGNESAIAHLRIGVRSHDAFVQVATRITNQRGRVGFSEYLYTLESSTVNTGQSSNDQLISQVCLAVASSESRRRDADPYVQACARRLRRSAHSQGGGDHGYAPTEKHSRGRLIIKNHLSSGDVQCRSATASLRLRATSTALQADDAGVGLPVLQPFARRLVHRCPPRHHRRVMLAGPCSVDGLFGRRRGGGARGQPVGCSQQIHCGSPHHRAHRQAQPEHAPGSQRRNNRHRGHDCAQGGRDVVSGTLKR